MTPEERSLSVSLGPIRLLLVEDSDHDIELTLLKLEAAGLQIMPTIAHDFREASRALADEAFDVIVCDYLLLGPGGAEVLEVARQLTPGTPFIFLSGVLGDQQAIGTIRLGAVDYVLKQNLDHLPRALTRAVQEVREREKLKAVEARLLEVEARARLAIEAAEMGVWELNPRTNELIWDERCHALYGLAPRSEVVLHAVLGMCNDQDKLMLERKIADALHHGSAFSAEYRITLPNGRVRWLSSTGRSVFKDGECVRFSGVLQDISERRRATQDLVDLTETLGERVEQRTRERDRTWEVSREMLGVLYFDMSPMTFNPAWEATLGWSAEHLQGMRLWELLHPLDVDSTINETRNIAQGNVSTRFVNRMRHVDGQYRWLSWTIVPDNGLMYAAVRDITEERAAIEALASTNQQLLEQITRREQAEATLLQMQRLEVVGQLTAGVAHDFNNLLTVILASAAFADKDMAKGKLDKIPTRLRNIMQAGERGARLTAQLLSFSRKQRLEPQAIDLNMVIAGMSDLLNKAVGGHVWLESNLTDGLWTASADATQTEMVILNLAINARDAMPNGGSLRLSTHNETITALPARAEDPESGDYVVIAVTDSGTGMSPEILQRAFEPFFTTKGTGQGSGLGLAQVFGFAKQSGGGVKICTVPGEGTSVRVYLPRMAVAPAFTADPFTHAPAESPGRQYSILLVDDDDGVREATAMMLESIGHRVIQASGGAAALAHSMATVDMVLTDFAMPGMSGKDLAIALNATQPKLPVVFLTGYADAEILGLNGLQVIQKPFTEDQLRERIQSAMTTH